jgi:hypothetical protein
VAQETEPQTGLAFSSESFAALLLHMGLQTHQWAIYRNVKIISKTVGYSAGNSLAISILGGEPWLMTYCWPTPKYRNCYAQHAFFEGKKAEQTAPRKSTPRTLKGVDQQYPPVTGTPPHIYGYPIPICTETRSICSVQITPACGKLLDSRRTGGPGSRCAGPSPRGRSKPARHSGGRV